MVENFEFSNCMCTTGITQGPNIQFPLLSEKCYFILLKSLDKFPHVMAILRKVIL